ncbi:DUF4870 domain-containing protein [Chloroflexota bacterium]
MSEVEREVVEALEVEEEVAPRETRKLEPGVETSQPRPRRAETQKLEPEEGAVSQTLVPTPHLGLDQSELAWAAMAHASILITLLLGIASGGLAAILGPIIPAVIWYVNRDKSDYVVEQARQATMYQLAGIVALLALATVGAVLVAVGWAVSAVLVVVLVGLLLLPVMLVVTLLWVVAIVALPIVQTIYGCYAALEAYNGRPFRYRWVADLMDRYLAQT